jgi:AcrR family transcriptional regulator
MEGVNSLVGIRVGVVVPGGEGTRDKILDSAYRLFYRHGFARVGVDEIAAAAGITKRTLYYHFKSKDELLATVLEAQRPLALDRIKRWAFLGNADPATALEGLFEELGRWIEKPRWSGSGYTRLAVELADLPGHPARRIAHVHKSEVEAVYRDFFGSLGVAEPETRARELMIIVEGAMLQTLFHGGTTYIEAALTLLRDRILPRRPQKP